MSNYSALHSFYTSRRWRDFRRVIISDRKPICEVCGKLITDPLDCEIDHYPIELTVANVNDANIALNPDNVRISCYSCHDKRHNRFCTISHGVYIIYGAPLAGKTSYVKTNMQRGDIVVDMDRLYTAISFLDMYDKPDSLSRNVFAVRDLLLDNIKTRIGKWGSAWIIGGYPEKYKREQFSNELGTELIYIETSKEECME
jgi:hypothetical protein